MPVKLSISLSRKVGEPNYGSRGATVGLEMEVDSSLVYQPRQLHERVARLFQLAKHSVDWELGGGSDELAQRNASARAAQFRPATSAQVRAIFAIANDLDFDLVDELSHRFGVVSPDLLSLEQASQLIDAIKMMTNGVSDSVIAP